MLKTQKIADDVESSEEEAGPETVNKATFMRPQSGKSTKDSIVGTQVGSTVENDDQANKYGTAPKKKTHPYDAVFNIKDSKIA
jgi:hypothetical protein